MLPLLFGEQARLICGSSGSGGLAAGDTHHAQYCDFGQGAAGNEDAVGGGVQVGRSDLQAIVDQREQVIGDDALERFIVRKAQTYPKPVKFGAAQKSFAFRLEVVGELADEIDGTDFSEGNLLVLAVGREDIDRFRLAGARRTEIAAQGFLVHKHYDDFLVRRGWGSVLQIRTYSLTLICETLGCMLC